MKTPVSKTQIRVIRIFNLSSDADTDTYEAAAAILTAARLPRDGMPFGMNWRQVAKMSDDELKSTLVHERDLDPAPTGSYYPIEGNW